MQRFADDFNIIHYSPIVFSAATVYFDEDPKLSLLLFSNGKYICAGVQLELDLQIACAKLAAMLKTDVPPEEKFTLRNIVGNDELWGCAGPEQFVQSTETNLRRLFIHHPHLSDFALSARLIIHQSYFLE